MDEIAPEYDVVVLGTGLTECVLSGVMSVKGKKVLHIDRNDHYGGESASLNIEALFKRYGNYNKGEEPWKKYGRVNDWNIDLVPKLLMSNGELTNILVSTDVTRYLEFKQIAGSYVQVGSGAKATVAKVPSDAVEALRSPLMGLFEKRRAKKFLEWVGAFKEDDPASYAGLNLNQCSMKEVYDKFGLEATTRDFIGHSMALYQTDEYINQKGVAKETVQRIRLYVNSMARYGKSPYIYPLYGLGELPQGFARLSAIYGGTYMLNTTVDEVMYDGNKATGIKATMKERGDETEGMKFSTKTKKLIADPSYFPGKVQVVGKLLKAICILTHPVQYTDNSDSAQLIIPQSQVGRKNDIYIAIVSSAHNVCPKGYYIAIVSTIAEGSSNHHLELQPGLDRLGKIEEIFMGPPIPLYEPLESGMNDNIFISKSYDATSHFETTTDDVRDIYQRAEKEELIVEGLREGTNLVGEEDLTANIVEVFVGPTMERYHVHETTLRKSCSFFKEKLRGSEQQGTKKSICLPDDDPEAFDMFATWLYEEKIKAVNARMKYKEGNNGFVKDLYATTDPYFALYYMATEIGLVSLKNHVMDTLQAFMAAQKFVFSPARTKEVYERTPAGSSLRQYLVENFLHHYMNKNLDEPVVKKAMLGRMRTENGSEFVLDLFEAIRLRKGKWRDPDKGTGCGFHDHDDGEECEM